MPAYSNLANQEGKFSNMSKRFEKIDQDGKGKRSGT